MNPWLFFAIVLGVCGFLLGLVGMTMDDRHWTVVAVAGWVVAGVAVLCLTVGILEALS